MFVYLDLRRECLANFGLGQIGHHGDGVLMSFRHFVQVDQDAGVTMVEMNTLSEEHRGVAMGVESENAAVQLFGYVEVVGLFDQPLEQRAAALQPLGMPLHAHHRLVLGALHALDDTVGRTGHHTETLAGVANGLMVERVDINLPLAKQLEQGGILFAPDGRHPASV